MANRLAFQTQLASIMEVLANAAVAEICKLVDDDYAVVSLQMSQCQRENKVLKRKLRLLELKMARGNAERRLRESAANNGRPRVQINSGDSLRKSSLTTSAVFERPVDVVLWSSRGDAGNEESQVVLSEHIQSKSPDVELVEPEAVLVKEEKIEPNMSHITEPEEDVPLLGDNRVPEHVPSGSAGQGPSYEQQNSQTQAQNQTLSSKRRRTGSNNNRGVEKEEEPNVVLVKVEEVELATGTRSQTGFSIQEGVVESSTDDYRGVLPFDETTQPSTGQLQESGGGFSEVSHSRSSLRTNEGVVSYCHDNSLPVLSSHCSPLSYLPSSLAGSDPSSSWSGLAVQSSKGFQTSLPFEQQCPDVSLSEGSSSMQVSGHIQAGQPLQVLQPVFQNPGPSKGQSSYSSTGMQKKIPRKRVYICRFCGKAFTSPANLESHLRTHTGERPYGCSICGKKFSQFWNLKIHKNIHTGERPYQCSLCLEKFSDPSNLKKHQKRHHPQM